MKHDDIVFVPYGAIMALVKRIDTARLEEREACAKLCDELDDRMHAEDCPPSYCADQIRRRVHVP